MKYINTSFLKGNITFNNIQYNKIDTYISFLLVTIFLYKSGRINYQKYKHMLKAFFVFNETNKNIELNSEWSKNTYHCGITDRWFDKYDCKNLETYYKEIYSDIKEDIDSNLVINGADIFNALKLIKSFSDPTVYILLENIFTQYIKVIKNVYDIELYNKILGKFLNVTPLALPSSREYLGDYDHYNDIIKFLVTSYYTNILRDQYYIKK